MSLMLRLLGCVLEKLPTEFVTYICHRNFIPYREVLSQFGSSCVVPADT
jgi:hypothetical protein